MHALVFGAINGIDRVIVHNLNDGEVESKENLANVEALCFANMNIIISSYEAKELKKMFPMLTHMSLASSVEVRQNARNIDFGELGITLSYMAHGAH